MKWGKTFGTVAVYGGAFALFGTGLILYSFTSNNTIHFYGGALLGQAGSVITSFSLIPAVIALEVQRRRTLRAFRASGKTGLKPDAPVQNFSVSLLPAPGGLSLAGTF